MAVLLHVIHSRMNRSDQPMMPSDPVFVRADRDGDPFWRSGGCQHDPKGDREASLTMFKNGETLQRRAHSGDLGVCHHDPKGDRKASSRTSKNREILQRQAHSGDLEGVNMTKKAAGK